MAIMIFQFAVLVARSILETSLIGDGYEAGVANDLSMLIVLPILLVLMYPYLRRCKDSLLGLFQGGDLTLRLVVLSILLGLTLRITRWAILTVLIWLGVVGNDDPDAIVGPLIGFDCPSPPVLLLSFGVMAFVVPIIEETVNRGFLLHALLPRGALMAAIVTSLLFAIMHPPGTYISAFVIGLVLAVQMLNYRTLWATIVTHAAYNGAMIVDWECFRIVWNPQPGDPDLLVLAGISVLIAMAGMGTALFLVSKKAAGACEAPRRV